MKFKNYLMLLAVFVFFTSICSRAEQTEIVVRGRWGSEPNQLGINFLAPGAMPSVPYTCIGGYDVTPEGTIWISDSVNRMVKSYSDRSWHYIRVNADKLGELSFFNGKIYLVTRGPDAVVVISPETGKTEHSFKIPFVNPGRLKVFRPKLIGLEDAATGLWIADDKTAFLHPATALEAVGNQNYVYGIQYNFVDDSRTIIKAELAAQVQEPELVSLYEAEDRILFSKMAGVIKDFPVFMVMLASTPGQFKFIKLGKDDQPAKTINVPALEGPYLSTAWRLCSDGNIYGFEGTASEGFRLHRVTKKF